MIIHTVSIKYKYKNIYNTYINCIFNCRKDILNSYLDNNSSYTLHIILYINIIINIDYTLHFISYIYT